MDTHTQTCLLIYCESWRQDQKPKLEIIRKFEEVMTCKMSCIHDSVLLLTQQSSLSKLVALIMCTPFVQKVRSLLSLLLKRAFIWHPSQACSSQPASPDRVQECLMAAKSACV